MLKSMTGYGHAQHEADGRALSIEIKSLNSRGLDLIIKLPKVLADKEMELRTELSNRLIRGKVNIYAELEHTNSALERKKLNVPVLEAYLEDLTGIAERFSLSKEGLLAQIANFNEVWETPEETPEELEGLFKKVMAEALAAFEAFRDKEGRALAAELKQYALNIEAERVEIEKLAPGRLERTRNSLIEKLKPLKEELSPDSSRLEQEMIYYAEKLDITEELVRLKGHVEHFLEAVESDNAGKKLNFISQEMGREINTIGSKANDAVIARKVVTMKEELEKIKEQVLNIL